MLRGDAGFGELAGGDALAASRGDVKGRADELNPDSAVCPPPACSTTACHDYYVAATGSDGNSGTVRAPWRTVQHAANVAVAGDVVHILPGTYVERILEYNSGTRDAPITFVSDPPWQATINGTGASGGRWVFVVNGSYVTLRDLDITAPDRGGADYGIVTIGEYDRVVGCHVHDGCQYYSGGGAAIGTNGSETLWSVGTVIERNLVWSWGPSIPDIYVHGIYYASKGTGGATIRNNIVIGVPGAGITGWHYDSDWNIENNLVINARSWCYIAGAGTCDPGTPICENLHHANNIGINCPVGMRLLGNLGPGNTQEDFLFWNVSTPFQGCSGVGTQIGNPAFADFTGDQTGDYHLTAASTLAVDKGTSTYVPPDDFDGYTRPVGTAPDIGPYEYGATLRACR